MRRHLLLSAMCCVFGSLLVEVGNAFPPRNQRVSGFVTEVNSQDRVLVGKLEIDVHSATQCSVGVFRTRRFWYKPLLAPDMFVIEESTHGYDNQVTYSERSCTGLKFPVGLWVKAEGSFTLPDKLSADRLTIYEWSNDVESQDGAVLEGSPAAEGNAAEKAWINGYPVEFNDDSSVESMPTRAKLVVEKQGFYDFYLRPSQPYTHAHPIGIGELQPGNCISYTGLSTQGDILRAENIYTWHCLASKSFSDYLRRVKIKDVVPPDYVHSIPGRIKLWRGHHQLQIIANEAVQNYVARVGTSVLPLSPASISGDSDSTINFRFYVVRSLGRVMSRVGPLENGVGFHKFEDAIVPMPDGLIIIAADRGIARIRDEAQLAALLAIAESKVLQQHRYIADSTIGYVSWALPDTDAFDLWQEAQAIRIGIRQMYLAGYDIREAPFAWLVANGKSVPNPIIGAGDSGSTVPWYAAYAFDYISKYYSDVDYSKLKRGEADYAQFLEELRKADPQAFEPSK